MENAIIIRSDNQFKSKALNTATAGLAKAFRNIENGRKDACAILAKVERNKSYKEDGFESLAEYAETIGLNKSLAHKMENAGRLIISENEKIKNFAENVDFSKLAILSSADEKDIEKAIDDGKLTAETTASKVKEIKAEMKPKNGKEKVEPEYTFKGIFVGGATGAVSHIDETGITQDFVNDWFLDTVFEVKRIVVKEEGRTPIERMVAIDINGNVAIYTMEKVEKKKTAKTKSIKNMTREEVLAALAALDNNE